MKALLFCAAVVTFMVIVPVFVAFGLWFRDRKNEERKGFWDPE